MHPLIAVFNQITPLTEADNLQLEKLLKPVQLAKGDYWIMPDRINHQIAFVEEGYLRKYYLKDGAEYTDYFYFDHDFCADLPAIIGDTHSHACIVAMQNTRLITFSYQQFNQLCEQSHALEHLHRKLVELTFLRFYRRTVSFILQSPAERYESLISTQPIVLQRATQYHIASFLGISPQHLSRLRGQGTIS